MAANRTPPPKDAKRIENALWGLFIGDALAMPVHWYYDPKNITKDFGPDGITKYEAARHPHPEAFMVGMEYTPDVEKAKALGRKYDILGPNARYYSTPYATQEIEIRGEREGQHGNAVASADERIHYHHGLQAGQNTVGAQLARVLIRSVVRNGRYSRDAFLEEFVEFMTTPRDTDPYTEIYLRRWFEKYSTGADPATQCALDQETSWSTGSMGGMIRPLVLSLLGDSPFEAVGAAAEHQCLTHRSQLVTSALGVTVPVMQALVRHDGDVKQLWTDASRHLRVPTITGEEMFAEYRKHEGPGNIPKPRVWEIHNSFESEPFDAERWAAEKSTEAVSKRLATACYTEHGVPLAFFLGAKHDMDLRSALLSNANIGGDCVHRGCVLGLLLGAATDHVPDDLKNDLADHAELAEEIRAFAALAARDGALLV